MVLAPGVSAGQRVAILTLSDSIQPASLRYLERGLATADASGAAVTIIDLNTPGGLLSSLRQMTTAITAARRRSFRRSHDTRSDIRPTVAPEAAIVHM